MQKELIVLPLLPFQTIINQVMYIGEESMSLIRPE